MNVLVLMAVSSEKFIQDGSNFPKFLHEIKGRPLVEHVINNLKDVTSNFIFVINRYDAEKWHLENVIKLLSPSAKIIIVDGETSGAACSALYAIEHINNNEELLIANGDQLIHSNIKKGIDHLRNYDGGTIIFDSVHPRWSYVKLNEKNLIIEASEKKPISKNATAGLYYFKQGKDFVEGASNMIKKDTNVNGYFFVCPVFNELILKHKKLSIYKIDRDDYHSLATVQAIKNYTGKNITLSKAEDAS